MTHGNMFVVYPAPGNNVTLSPRRATGPYEPFYTPDIQAQLLNGSGIGEGTLTANIRCDNCMFLHDGSSIMGPRSEWIWALAEGAATGSRQLTRTLKHHDWHGIFSLDLTRAVGGNSDNPFLATNYSTLDYSSMSNQQQTCDPLLHRKRIAHGSMSGIAFVLLFPNFALTLYIFPSRQTVARIHGPLQTFATITALVGLGLGVSVSKDIHDVSGYHPIIGYIVILGIVLFQPILGIIQHLRFRKTGQKNWTGLAHRYLGRFFCVLGVVNGGIGFYYANSKTPGVPDASRYSYGFIVGTQGVIYVLVIVWRRSRDAKSKARIASDSESQMIKGAESGSESRSVTDSGSFERVDEKP